MRGYLYTVVCMAALSGVVLLVAPDGVKSGLKKHIRLICSICMLCIMISPISRVVDGIKNIGDMIIEPDKEDGLHSAYESMYEEKNEENFSEVLEDAVKEELKNALSISANECRTIIEFSDVDDDGFREPVKITVVLSGTAIFKNPRNVESIIFGKFGCDCVCAIE